MVVDLVLCLVADAVAEGQIRLHLPVILGIEADIGHRAVIPIIDDGLAELTGDSILVGEMTPNRLVAWIIMTAAAGSQHAVVDKAAVRLPADVLLASRL